jgi:hypothetical protein
MHRVRTLGPAELQLIHRGANDLVSWRNAPNVFSETRSLGYDTALAGWYHPYCRVLNRDLTSCWWMAMPMQYNSVGRTFARGGAKLLTVHRRDVAAFALRAVAYYTACCSWTATHDRARKVHSPRFLNGPRVPAFAGPARTACLR